MSRRPALSQSIVLRLGSLLSQALLPEDFLPGPSLCGRYNLRRHGARQLSRDGDGSELCSAPGWAARECPWVRYGSQLMAYKVFVSHASSDKWVAGQIAKELGLVGADHFLDSKVLETGDQLDGALRSALNDADELLVLLTPAALQRPYVWIEIGAAWSQGKRIIGIMYGLTTSELAERDGTPAFLTGVVLRDINELDTYLAELGHRLANG